jgi:hypothetical protein
VNTRRRAALAVIVALATASCAALHPGGESAAAPPAADTAEPYQLIQEPERGYAAIYALLVRARTSIRMTMYELDDPAATSALVAARRRGVDVRVLLDAAFHGRNTNADAYTQLAAAGIDVRWAPPGIIYHQKTITIDNVETAVGTGNLDARWYPTSRDAWILDTNSTDVAAIADTFDADDNPAPSGHPRRARTALVTRGTRHLPSTHRRGIAQHRRHHRRAHRPGDHQRTRESRTTWCHLPHRAHRRPGPDPYRRRARRGRVFGPRNPRGRPRPALHTRKDAPHRPLQPDHRQPQPLHGKPSGEPGTVAATRRPNR